MTIPMLRIIDQGTQLCDGITRRDWLRIGSIGLGGLSLPGLLANQTALASGPNSLGKAKSVIIFGLVGGPPQHDTWDPKPQAPKEIRGEFGTIPSKTPGLRVGELIAQDRTAKRQDRRAASGRYGRQRPLIKWLSNVDGDSPSAAQSRKCLAQAAQQLAEYRRADSRTPRDRPGQLPAAITLPEHIWNDGNFPWPGQDAGFLGRSRDPWLIHCDPQDDKFHVQGLQKSKGITPLRFDSRRTLLQQMNSSLDKLRDDGRVGDIWRPCSQSHGPAQWQARASRL